MNFAGNGKKNIFCQLTGGGWGWKHEGSSVEGRNRRKGYGLKMQWKLSAFLQF